MQFWLKQHRYAWRYISCSLSSSPFMIFLYSRFFIPRVQSSFQFTCAIDNFPWSNCPLYADVTCCFKDGGRCVNVSVVRSLGERIWQDVCRFRYLVGGNRSWPKRNNIWRETEDDTALFYVRSTCSQSADNFSRKCQIGGELIRLSRN